MSYDLYFYPAPDKEVAETEAERTRVRSARDSFWTRKKRRYMSRPSRIHYPGGWNFFRATVAIWPDACHNRACLVLAHFIRVSSVVCGMKQRIAKARSFIGKVEAIERRVSLEQA